eukprot:CAMPEP_0184874038 /NCGR_PEP_ID=MMETSP0580-20130426/42172_1 /TAXON_ID=1118495 /ORGANISM="Dactyliosolen fragilissimus" /LENGTH=892 /DNA_ID=CAMNT_0027377005 /DNA_START=443 /DNA_END=3121 /DNA_ORIENTATION=+
MLRHLSIREKEVEALVARCATQEEKLSDVKNERILATQLKEEVEDLKFKVEERDRNLVEMDTLRELIEETENAKREALKEVCTLRAQNQKNTDGLLSLLESLKDQLASEKKQSEIMKDKINSFQVEKVAEETKFSMRYAELESRNDAMCKKKEELELEIKAMYARSVSLEKRLDMEQEEKGIEIKNLKAQIENERLSSTKALYDTKLKLENQQEVLREKFQKELATKDALIFEMNQDLASLNDDNERLHSEIEVESRIKKEIGDERTEIETKYKETIEEINKTLRNKELELEDLQSLINQKDREAVMSTEEITYIQNQYTLLEKSKNEESLEHQKKIDSQSDEICNLKKIIDEKENIIAKNTNESMLLKEQALTFESKAKRVSILEQELIKEKQLQNQRDTENQSAMEKVSNDLKQAYSDQEKMEINLKDKLSKAEQQNSSLAERMEHNFNDSQKIITDLKNDLESKREELLLKTSAFQNLEVEFSNLEKNSNLRIQSLEGNVKNLNLSLSRKNMEINALESDKILKLEERVSSLQGENLTLTDKISATEVEAAEIVEELDQKLERTTEELSSLQKQKNEELTALKEMMNTLKEEVSNLSAELEQHEKMRKEKDDQIHEMEKNMLTKSQENTNLEKNVNELKDELVLLIDAFDASKKEYEGKLVALELDLDQQRTYAEDDAAAFQEDFDQLQDMAREAEEKLAKQEIELEDTRSLLEERTKLLEEMVSQNRKLANDLQEARELVAQLQEESDKFTKRIDDAEAKYEKSRKELGNIYNEHEMEIQSEFSLRESIQFELERAKKELRLAQTECKAIPKLKDEIKLLEDKVERQKNFLERKILREKMLKERYCLTGTVVSKSKSTMLSRQSEKETAEQNVETNDLDLEEILGDNV